MKFEYFPIEYECPESLANKAHYIVIAKLKKEDVLLSHVNLYLADNTASSLKTSRPAAINLICFYRYLSTTEKMKDVHISQYHILADNLDIKRWQVQRQIERLIKNDVSPSSETIYNDAKRVLSYFKYLTDKGYTTGVKVKLTTWVANFKSRNMLNYIKKRVKEKIDPSNIKALDIQNRQRKPKSLITHEEILNLIEAYPDPVFAVMFVFGLGTAIRVQEICEFPYAGKGENMHLKPYSEMNKEFVDASYTEYTIYKSKNKDRTIHIPMSELKLLEESYIKTLYPERKKKYKNKHGKECPPSILFLDKSGDPVDEEKVSSATTYAKKLAIKKNPKFRQGLNFYENRHWWPTQKIIDHYGDRLLTKDVDVLNASLAQTITNQMGHNDISTTFSNYVDLARVITLAEKGLGNETFTSKESAIEKIRRLEEEKK